MLINIKTKHAYLTTALISDKRTAFTSHVIIEVAGVLGITLKHATTKHAQIIGLIERSHASIKQSLKIETGERRSLWHKYVSIAVLNYNASYHASIGCEPSRVFHGRIPYNILDIKMSSRPQKIPSPDSQIAQDVLEQMEIIFQDVRKNAMQAYIKYKAYHDKKANASKLKQADYVFILQPKADHQGSKNPFTDFCWIGLYIFEKVLPNINYWYAKLALIRRKFFTEWSYDKSHPANRYQTYQSHHANGNETWKLSLNMMIYTPEHGSVNMMSQYLKAITIIWQRLVHPKLQYDPSKQLTKWRTLREPYEKIHQKLFLSHIDRMMKGT